MRVLKFITGHVIYNPAYTYKFQLKTTQVQIRPNVGLVQPDHQKDPQHLLCKEIYSEESKKLRPLL